MLYICNIEDVNNAISVYNLDCANKLELLDFIHGLYKSDCLSNALVSASTADNRQVVIERDEDFSYFEAHVLEHGFDHVIAIYGSYKDIDVCLSFQYHNLTCRYVMAVIVNKSYDYIKDEFLQALAV